MEVSGEVERIIQNLGGRIIALGDGRVHLQAGLARRSGVGAQRALFLAVWGTKGLKQAKHRAERDQGGGGIMSAVRCGEEVAKSDKGVGSATLVPPTLDKE